ncbi:MAG: hypothetical protein R2764_23290 [Bacteroidales bacterium]
METIIQKTGQLLFHFNLRGRRLLYKQIFRNHTSMVVSILLFSLIVLLLVFLIFGLPIAKILIYTSITIFCLFIVLLLVGSMHEAKRLERASLHSSFQFNRSNLNGISLSRLGFSESEQENLNMVLNNLQPKNKIEFRLVSDNRIAADYKKLFRILHLLINGGIKDFKKERKEILFNFIENTFTLNGSEVKRASLNSRFSEFVNESETEFSENLKAFQKILSG